MDTELIKQLIEEINIENEAIDEVANYINSNKLTPSERVTLENSMHSSMEEMKEGIEPMKQLVDKRIKLFNRMVDFENEYYSNKEDN